VLTSAKEVLATVGRVLGVPPQGTGGLIRPRRPPAFDPSDLRLLIDTVVEGLWCVDLEGRCTFVNRAACDMLGRPAEDLLGSVVHDLVHHSHEDGSPYPAAECAIGRAGRIGQSIRVENDVLWRRDGTSFPISHAASPIVKHGAVVGSVVTFTDITRRRQAEEELRRHRQAEADRLWALALHDDLTGLGNRTLLNGRLTQALARARRKGRLLALLFCDLDRFKAVNDLHGHQAGDELLVQVGARLRDVVRPEDTVTRLGGDEFVVLCEDIATELEATIVAERVRAALADPFDLSVGRVRIGCSVGVATTRGADAAPHDLLAEADQRMYEAKAPATTPLPGQA
jgi:diguanylate cyclase (GGDEF)-like protein/PAS domain S-box-containing protein